MRIATRMAYDARAHSDEHEVDLGGPSPTQQHLKRDADINEIMRRFGMTGSLPPGVSGGVYGDFSGIEDFDDALRTVERAQAGFMALPAEIREKFQNDPGRMIHFASYATPEEFSRVFDEAAYKPAVSHRPAARTPSPP